MPNAIASRGVSGGDSRAPEVSSRSRNRSHTTTSSHAPSRRRESDDEPIAVRPPPSAIKRNRETSKHDSTHTRGRESSKHDTSSSSTTRGSESSASSHTTRGRDSSASSNSTIRGHRDSSASSHSPSPPPGFLLMPPGALDPTSTRDHPSRPSSHHSRSRSHTHSHHPSTTSSHRSSSHDSISRDSNHGPHCSSSRSRSPSTSTSHSHSRSHSHHPDLPLIPSHSTRRISPLAEPCTISYQDPDGTTTLTPPPPVTLIAPSMPMDVACRSHTHGHHRPGFDLGHDDDLSLLMGPDGFSNLRVAERAGGARPGSKVTVEVTEVKIHIQN